MVYLFVHAQIKNVSDHGEGDGGLCNVCGEHQACHVGLKRLERPEIRVRGERGKRRGVRGEHRESHAG